MNVWNMQMDCEVVNFHFSKSVELFLKNAKKRKRVILTKDGGVFTLLLITRYFLSHDL